MEIQVKYLLFMQNCDKAPISPYLSVKCFKQSMSCKRNKLWQAQVSAKNLFSFQRIGKHNTKDWIKYADILS